MRFPKAIRLTEAADFSKVFATDKKLFSRFFCIHYSLEPGTPARIGVITGKKHLKRAVARNRARRLVREWFRHHTQELVGYRLVVVVLKRANDATNEEITACLTQELKRLKKQASS